MYKVLNYLSVNTLSQSENYMPKTAELKKEIVQIVKITEDILEKNFSSDHITNVFKSAKKCDRISSAIDNQLGREYNLFNPLPNN